MSDEKEFRVDLKPGQIVRAYGPAGQRVSIYQPKDKTYGRVTAPGLWVPPGPAPEPEVPGWREAFRDDFAVWDPSLYRIYPSEWTDTSGRGQRNSPDNISVVNGTLRGHIRTYNGRPCGVHFVPLINGFPGGDVPSMRIAFRMRVDLLPGYKVANLMWPADNNWPWNGENDTIEADLNGTRVSAFIHHQGATVGNDQTHLWYPTTHKLTDWNDYIAEWVDGQYVELWANGVSLGRVTNRIANTLMHYVFQYETNLSGQPISSATQGYMELQKLRIWVPA